MRTWKSDCNPGASAYLLPNGNLLRTGAVKNPPFFGGGAGGRVQEFTFDGELIWDFTLSSPTKLSHHDICKLPNGNLLMIVWEKKTAKEAIAAGRRPETVKQGHLNADCILEIQPMGKTGGKIVWEWHTFDHLIQEFDSKVANHGDPAAHPELIDVNFGEGTLAAIVARPEELKKLQAIGYVGGPTGKKGGPGMMGADWLHTNAIAYNAELDQIMLSIHEFNEIWIIDHSTTTAEAAGHKGGKYGKGGDLLYRWGNPRAYRAGAVKDQKLFGQHNAHWIPKGRPGAGHVMIFNNGMRRVGGAHSTVDEIVLPVDAKGHYEKPGKAYGPDKVHWSYAAPKKSDFFSSFISGAERLPNGNTLICSGANGTVFEVTPTKEMVWKYVVPLKGGFGGPGGPGGKIFGGPPRPGQLLPPFLHGMLNLTDEQKKQLETAEKGLAAKLDQLLTAEQKKKLKDGPGGFGPGFGGPGFGGPPQFGQLMPAPVQERLKLTDDQKKQLAGLQKEADSKLDTLLEAGQKKQLKDMQGGIKKKKGPGGFGGGPGGGFAGPPGLFRAPRYAPDYPGLVGRTLTPGALLEDLVKDVPKKKG